MIQSLGQLWLAWHLVRYGIAMLIEYGRNLHWFYGNPGEFFGLARDHQKNWLGRITSLNSLLIETRGHMHFCRWWRFGPYYPAIAIGDVGWKNQGVSCVC